jgi:cytochrome c553
MTSPRLSIFVSILAFSLGSAYSAAIDFAKDVLPILEDRCLKCHGPDKQKANLRLDRRAIMLKGGDSGLPSIVPGKPEKSFLIEVVKQLDPEMAMPPKGDPLTSEQVAALEKWIAEGAKWPGQMDAVAAKPTSDHWSLQPVKRPEIPAGKSHPIDAFLSRALEKAELKANPGADPLSLVRRASITLTGLPPTPERSARFVSHFKNDPQAYEKLIEELLASPHFGERWAQHWLDAIRWAETNGSEANLYRKNAWVYRDYVVRAFNNDVPYNQFISEQIAGDTMGAGEATGFLVAGPHVPAATVGAEATAIRQARADRLDEVVQTVGASMLGMTVSCARCHNHKFDPISIQDYYALTAVFQGVEFGGRHPELSDEHPRKKRAKELYRQIFKERQTLRQAGLSWAEHWGGFQDYQFKAETTKAVRIDFTNPSVFIDELEIFGPKDHRQNFALSSEGATLKTDPAMTQNRGDLHNANDGYFGTMMWKSKAPKDSPDRPWVEIHFTEPQTVNRFRSSSNREYYFETDYLVNKQGKKSTAYYPPNFRISTLQEDGTWKQIAHSQYAKNRLNKDPELKAAHNRLHTLIGQLSEEGPRHSFIGRFQKPVGTKVLHRGSPENPRDEVMPRGFEILDGDLGLDSSAPDPERRRKFAEWLIRPENPLTSRVMVNRIWHHIFGMGIVPTASDFGLAGAPPSHPELLDFLASEFVEEDWSMKSMIRLIVSSDAFRRASNPESLALQSDASSTLLWRFPPRRIEAEVIRDGILQASGKLDPSIGGRSFRIHNEKQTYSQWEVVDNHGPKTWRRMLYQERMRRVDDQIFTAFDFPDCGQVRAKRSISTTPLQALNLLNSPFVVTQSEFIAERALSDAGGDQKGAVTRAFHLLLNRAPSGQELTASLEIVSAHGLPIVCRTLINSNEFAFLP